MTVEADDDLHGEYDVERDDVDESNTDDLFDEDDLEDDFDDDVDGSAAQQGDDYTEITPTVATGSSIADGLDGIQCTDTMFWAGLQLGSTELYDYLQQEHEDGYWVSEEDMPALVIDRLTEEERELARKILFETDVEALRELLALPLCCPKVIDTIQVCFDGDDPNYAGKLRGGDSSLLRAARYLQVDKVRLLLEAGADSNVKDLFDSSALHMVLEWNSAEQDVVQEIIKLFMEYGYNPTCVNAEKKKTAFEVHSPPTSQEEDDKFGEGLYEVFDVVPWSEIEAAILMDNSSNDDQDDPQVVQIVRRLVALGWGPGADKGAVLGKKETNKHGGCCKMIRDRLQIANQVAAPRSEKQLFLYYWDDRDGPSFEGWWVADGLGSNSYNCCCIGDNYDTPPGAGDWMYQADTAVEPELDFVPIYGDGEVEEEEEEEKEEGDNAETDAQVIGYRIDHPNSGWHGHGKVFNLTHQIHHWKPVYATKQGSSKLEDRCSLLVDKVLLPLLDLAGQERLEDTEEAPCMAFARYLLASRVASVCQEKVLMSAGQGLSLLEKALVQSYVEVGPSLDSSCGPLKTMLCQDAEWEKMIQYHVVPGDMDWMETTGDQFLLKSVVALCREGGYTLEEICQAFSPLAWTNKEAYRSSAYTLWLLQVTKQRNGILKEKLEARIAQKNDEDEEEIKQHRRFLEKYSDSRDQIFTERNYDVEDVADITRVSLESPTPDDLIHCFKAITEANIEEHGFEVVRIKNGFSSENVNPRGGYRDVLFSLRVRGPEGGCDRIAEVQLLLKKFASAKKRMQLLYEVVRGSCF